MDEYMHTEFEDGILPSTSDVVNSLVLRGRSPYKSVIQLVTNGIARPDEDAAMLATFLSANLDKSTFDAFKVFFINNYILPEIQAQGQLMNSLMGFKASAPVPRKVKNRKESEDEKDTSSDQ